MSPMDLLSRIVACPALERLPLVTATIRQKWHHSHYLHGAMADAAGALAGRPAADRLAAARALEIGWAAILLLDDIVDQDTVRYHDPAAWVQAGTPAATLEIATGLLTAVQLAPRGDETRFLGVLQDTVAATKAILALPPTTGVRAAEPWFRQLGAMSGYAVAWPWPSLLAAWEAAGFETCAGQLVNDCNDCFGAKARRRGYPDLRNRQVTLLTAVLVDAYPRVRVELLLDRNATGAPAEASAQIYAAVHDDPAPLLAVFDGWWRQALASADALEHPLVRAAAQARITDHGDAWRAKLKRLLAGRDV